MDSRLVTNLIYYHRIRNAAEGVGYDTRFVTGLIDYGLYLQNEEAARLTKAAFYQGVIDDARRRVDRMIESADTPDKRRAILPDVVRLSNLAQEAQEKLSAMVER